MFGLKILLCFGIALTVCHAYSDEAIARLLRKLQDKTYEDQRSMMQEKLLAANNMRNGGVRKPTSKNFEIENNYDGEQDRYLKQILMAENLKNLIAERRRKEDLLQELMANNFVDYTGELIRPAEEYEQNPLMNLDSAKYNVGLQKRQYATNYNSGRWPSRRRGCLGPYKNRLPRCRNRGRGSDPYSRRGNGDRDCMCDMLVLYERKNCCKKKGECC